MAHLKKNKKKQVPVKKNTTRNKKFFERKQNYDGIEQI